MGGKRRLDPLSPRERSARMGLVRGKDTKPEMRVRRTAHSMGYRYRLHDGDLPGKPDLVFKSRRKVIFVHGCFWHRHEGCPRCRTPKTRLRFWKKKFRENVDRDARNGEALLKSGWEVLVIWECETENRKLLASKLRKFLGK